jgi:hypothetical protein
MPGLINRLRLSERLPAPLRSLDDRLSPTGAQSVFRAGGSGRRSCLLLDAARRFRWAAAILARAAADILRLTGVGALPSGVLGLNIWRSSAI